MWGGTAYAWGYWRPRRRGGRSRGGRAGWGVAGGDAGWLPGIPGRRRAGHGERLWRRGLLPLLIIRWLGHARHDAPVCHGPPAVWRPPAGPGRDRRAKAVGVPEPDG